MLFRKRIERACAYCVHSTKIGDDQILCVKKGLRPLQSQCRKFKYDPCKRVPLKVRALDFSKYDNEDFSL